MTGSADIPQQIVPADNIEFLIQRIRKIRDDEGVAPADMMRFLADAAGVSLRTAYRWVERGTRQPTARLHAELTPELRSIYFQVNGSVHGVLRYCRENGIPCPRRSTLQTIVNRDMSAADRGYAKNGEHARRANTMYLKKEYGHRNAVWETDHTELGVYVIPPWGNGKPVKPWLTTFMDAKTRAIPGASISLRPTAGDVIASFRSAVMNDTESISPVFGVPDELHWDNGREFLSNAMTQVAAGMGVYTRALPAYAPHLKGKIERWHWTLQQEFLSTLPYYDRGPRAANGELYGSEGARLSYAHFCELLLNWIRSYNFERAHSALDGLTPAETWLADPAMVREVPTNELRWMALPSKLCKVGKAGIHHARHKYVSAELIALRGEEVEIRYMPHDERSIEVYRNGKFICTAYVSEALSAEEEQRFIAERQRQQRTATAERRKASRRARVRFASVTSAADDPSQQVTVIDRQQAAAVGDNPDTRTRQARVRSAAPAGLNEPWTPPTNNDPAEAAQ
jgi:putative transposase